MQITIPSAKRIAYYINYATRNSNTFKRIASFKGSISNTCHTIWNINTRK